MLRSLWDRSPALFIFFGLVPLIFSTFIGIPEAWAQAAPAIVHEGIDCLVTNHHAILKAVVDPPGEVRIVRVYFRSALYPEFYFIEMKQEGDQFQAVLPKPKPET